MLLSITKRLLLSVLCTVAFTSFAQESVTLITPAPVLKSTLSGETEATKPQPAYIKRTGAIRLNTSLLLPAGAAPALLSDLEQQQERPSFFQNTLFELRVFDDLGFSVVIDRANYHSEKSVSLLGRLKGGDGVIATLTVTDSSYLGTIRDVKSGLIYRISGDSSTGEGSVSEVDLYAMPPRIHEHETLHINSIKPKKQGS
ncbi:hypothetical protein [Neptunomonas concharum]|uniref:Pilus assembly protein PilP n=1 Tax=Neptunomonas concharum TaxID=1031538 RepID=A0A5P1RET7_9GAMM|nr:hypothetical protein [Neptunomonas concharum]QEQ98117.1 hypothetical protein F0U83_16135 [Neptunomonas concharum]